MAGAAVIMRLEPEGKGNSLKKRSKKLLLAGGIAAAVLAHVPFTICCVPNISDVHSLSVLLNE